jgi:dienelactone hydrolase
LIFCAKVHRLFSDKCPGNFLLDEERKHPILFLYSSGDSLIPSTYVEALADIQEARGRKVFREDFGPMSWHVAHYKNYPDFYEEEVEKFIQEVKKGS